jgi:hypothetical protein
MREYMASVEAGRRINPRELVARYPDIAEELSECLQGLAFVQSAAAEIGAAARREIRYTPVTLEQHAAELAEHGVAPEVIELLTYLFGEVVDGRNAHTTDGVRRALGREPRDFADYARAAAADGSWSPAHSSVA